MKVSVLLVKCVVELMPATELLICQPPPPRWQPINMQQSVVNENHLQPTEWVGPLRALGWIISWFYAIKYETLLYAQRPPTPSPSTPKHSESPRTLWRQHNHSFKMFAFLIFARNHLLDSIINKPNNTESGRRSQENKEKVFSSTFPLKKQFSR